MKTPPASALEGFFEVRSILCRLAVSTGAHRRQANKESMISFIEMAHTGVRGVVRKNGQPVAATISVDGIEHNMYTDPAKGDFYRPLTEGTCARLPFAPSEANLWQTCSALASAMSSRPARSTSPGWRRTDTPRSPSASIDRIAIIKVLDCLCWCGRPAKVVR